jgi:hypothetical protein
MSAFSMLVCMACGYLLELLVGKQHSPTRQGGHAISSRAAPSEDTFSTTMALKPLGPVLVTTSISHRERFIQCGARVWHSCVQARLSFRQRWLPFLPSLQYHQFSRYSRQQRHGLYRRSAGQITFLSSQPRNSGECRLVTRAPEAQRCNIRTGG